MFRIAVLALPDVIAFDLATPIEIFGRARMPDGRPAYQVLVCGASSSVKSGPVTLEVSDGLDALRRADTIIVPGRHRVADDAPPEVLEALRASARDRTRLASICVGAFTLAEAGLLDGLRATTHWDAARELARRYPLIEVDPNVLFVDNGSILTSAGASAGIDLCLHLVHADHGAAVAADASRLTVAPLHRRGGQAQYILPQRPSSSASMIGAALEWIECNAHRELLLEDIAQATHVSVRTLSRRFNAELGQSPMDWVIGVRVRHAQELLEVTDHGVERIARHVGFASPSSFRAHFHRLLGVAPREYRSTFRHRPE